MELATVLERAAGLDLANAERTAVCQMFADLARLAAWIEARRVAGVHRLEALPDVRFAEVVVEEATKEPAREAARTVQRATTLRSFPRFMKALEAGDIHPAHVDALTAALSALPEDKRPLLVSQRDQLLDLACHYAPKRFERLVRHTTRHLLSDEDAAQRLRRQRGARGLALWLNRITEMLHMRGQFDPECGAELVARIESAKQQLFPDPSTCPEDCPADPGARDDYLRALALQHLLLHGDAPGWRRNTAGSASASLRTSRRLRLVAGAA